MSGAQTTLESQEDAASSRVRLMSFNIAAGTATARYSEYVTRSWRQVLPHSERTVSLEAAAEVIGDFDLVALQETDSGSLRSGFINQTRFLAHHAKFPYWSHQSNRKVGKLAYPGNGFLSRFEPFEVTEHRLPGAIPGRGALWMHLGTPAAPLFVIVLHLALGRRARARQLQFIADELAGHPHAVVMGDMNTELDSPEMQRFMESAGLFTSSDSLWTYPSWEPQRGIDHILVTRDLSLEEVSVVDTDCSDHCAISAVLKLPEGFELPREQPEQGR